MEQFQLTLGNSGSTCIGHLTTDPAPDSQIQIWFTKLAEGAWPAQAGRTDHELRYRGGDLENSQLGAGIGDFIEKYIFPGSELLQISEVLEHMARAGPEMLDT